MTKIMKMQAGYAMPVKPPTSRHRGGSCRGAAPRRRAGEYQCLRFLADVGVQVPGAGPQ